MVFIGIDPGKSGALAVLCEGGETVLTPFDELGYRNALSRVAAMPARAAAVVERVGAMPKQGVTSMFSFGTNYGYIQGLLSAFAIPYELVVSAKWKKAFGVTADKNTSIAVAQRLFPDVDLRRTQNCRKPDDGMAEALLMAEYARRKFGCSEG